MKSRINPNGKFNFYYLFYNPEKGFVVLLERSEKRAKHFLGEIFPCTPFSFKSRNINVLNFNLEYFTLL